MDNFDKEQTNNCEVCIENIIDCEIRTVEGGWFSMKEPIKYCPWCGKELNR